MKSYTADFFRYLFGARKANTSDTETELTLLEELAARSCNIVEVGVYEGVASYRMAKSSSKNSHLYLVDPFLPSVRLEHLLRFSMASYIARRTVRPYNYKIKFLEMPSLAAAKQLRGSVEFDLIFIDARHDYQSVLEDFIAWQPLLSPSGNIAFHDSRCCDSRPDLNLQTGSVKLTSEILSGVHGRWTCVEQRDSISVFQRNALK
jgi:predicted O-methyltransferase YrrM